MTVADIRKNLQDQNFAYDMIISGINLWLFHYNIAPYFHSGQVKEGFNLSRVRDPRLDSLVEKLTEKLYYSTPDTLRTLQWNIQQGYRLSETPKTMIGFIEWIKNAHFPPA